MSSIYINLSVRITSNSKIGTQCQWNASLLLINFEKWMKQFSWFYANIYCITMRNADLLNAWSQTVNKWLCLMAHVDRRRQTDNVGVTLVLFRYWASILRRLILVSITAFSTHGTGLKNWHASFSICTFTAYWLWIKLKNTHTLLNLNKSSHLNGRIVVILQRSAH